MITYEVVIGGRPIGTHEDFWSAFKQYADTLTMLSDCEPLREQALSTCWIARKWAAGNVPAFFVALCDFATKHGLIEDNVLSPKPIRLDEAVVERFFIEVRTEALAGLEHAAVTAEEEALLAAEMTGLVLDLEVLDQKPSRPGHQEIKLS